MTSSDAETDSKLIIIIIITICAADWNDNIDDALLRFEGRI